MPNLLPTLITNKSGDSRLPALFYARYLFVAFLFLSPVITWSQPVSKKDSLTQKLKTIEARRSNAKGTQAFTLDTQKVIVFTRLAEAWLEDQPEKALMYAQQGITLGKQLHFLNGLAKSNRYAGLASEYLGDNKNAMLYYQTALDYFTRLDNKEGIANGNMDIGIIQEELNNYPKALEYYIKALHIMEAIHNKPGISNCYDNMGNVYADQGNNEEALKCYQIGLNIKKEANDQKGISSCYSNMANVFGTMGKMKEALEKRLASLEIRKKLGNPYLLEIEYANLGENYNSLNRLDDAIQIFELALHLSDSIQDKNGIAYALRGLGQAHLKKKQLDKAEYYENKALAMAKTLGIVKLELNVRNDRHAMLAALGKYKNAYGELRILNDLQDSVFNGERREKIKQLEMQQEMEHVQQAHYLEAAKTEAAHAQKLQRQKWIRNGMSAAFIVMGFFAVIFFKQRNRINKEKQISDRERARSN